MMRLQLTEDDQILVCQLVATAERIVRGSVQRACEECGRQVWKAPGPPLVAIDKDGKLQRVGILDAHNPVVLCIPCADMHYRALTGRGLGL